MKERKHKPTSSALASQLRSVACVAMMGELLAGDTVKEKNDWKTRMLKTGIPQGALHMPEDWDTLSEDEKERRLNLAIKCLK